MSENKIYYESPLGWLEITGDRRGVRSVEFWKGRKKPEIDKKAIAGHPAPLKACVVQLDEYFRGRRRRFDVRLEIKGTEFQKKVWRALVEIPYGKTASYRDIAKAVGNENATRAVGGANHANPISIIVPCHRIIGSDGRLTGYGGGLWRKEWLLAHEAKSRR